MNVTRRRFLKRVAVTAAPSQPPFELNGRASGVRVVILGAELTASTVANATFTVKAQSTALAHVGEL